MSTLDDPGLFPRRPVPLRQPSFWLLLMALSALLVGLAAIALPDSISGPVVWMFDVHHGLRMADVIGMPMLASGSAMIWIISLIRQWRCTH